MKHLLTKATALFLLLLPVVFGHSVSSQEPEAKQSLAPKPSDSQQSFTPIPSPSVKEGSKTDEIAKTKALKDEDKKKNKKVTAKTDEKSKPVTTETKPKETSSSVTPKDAKTPSPTSSADSGWFVGLRGSYVPGVIGEIGYQFNKTVKLRLIGAGFIPYDRTLSLDGQTYNPVKFKPQKAAFMLDWHFVKNGARVSVGFAFNGDRIRLNHTVTGTLLNLPASVYGNVSATYLYNRSLAPYIGLGYDSGSLGESGISLSADAGFWFEGKVRSKVNFTGTGRSTPSITQGLQDHLNNLINNHRMMKTVPMVSLGVRYMF